MDYAGNPNSVFVEAIVRKSFLVLTALLLAAPPAWRWPITAPMR